MALTGAVMRVRVDDLDAAVEFYEALTGEPAHHFAFSGAQLAAVGRFLVFRADGEVGDLLARVVATITVDDLDGDLARLLGLGAQVLVEATETPNGRRAVVRHPDGAVFEYAGR